MKYLLIILCILGTLLPYSQFIPYTMEHGPDFVKLFSEPFSTTANRGFAFDLMIAALTLVVFIIYEGRRLRMKNYWIAIVAIFAVGASLGFPLFLLLRHERLKSVNSVQSV